MDSAIKLGPKNRSCVFSSRLKHNDLAVSSTNGYGVSGHGLDGPDSKSTYILTEGEALVLDVEANKVS